MARSFRNAMYKSISFHKKIHLQYLPINVYNMHTKENFFTELALKMENLSINAIINYI